MKRLILSLVVLAAPALAQQDVGSLPIEAAANPSPAVAPPAVTPADTRRTLWQNVRYQMTRAEIEALYPASERVTYAPDKIEIDDFIVTGTCEADIELNFVDGKIDNVLVIGGSALAGRCSDAVLTGLSARYGEPLSREESHASILAREGRVFVWNANGITLRYKRYSSGVFGGGGLLGRSWELRYSTIADDLAL